MIHCNENPIYVSPEKELCGLCPNFHIHVSVSNLYIPRIGPNIFLQQNRQTDSGNVPAETTSPEPERFFGRKRRPVPNLPFPHPQHLAEGLSDSWSKEAWWIGTSSKAWYRTCIWCSEKQYGTGMGWSIHFRYTRNTLGTLRTRVGVEGEFSFVLDHPPFLNRQRKAGISFPAFVEPVLDLEHSARH